MKQFELYFLMFSVISVFGWAMEVACKYIEYGRFINRGFLIGPYCPIYGIGAVLATLLLGDLTDSPLTAFFMAMLVCGILEYAASWIMEKLFRARWWDYSSRRFNINGRICLNTLIPFGILCLVLIYFIKPFLFGIFESIPDMARHIVCAVLALMFIADIAVSAKTLMHIRSSAEHTGADDTELLTRTVRAELMKKGLLIRRYMKAYPYLKLYNSGILQKIEDAKLKLRKDAQEIRQKLKER